ncbi:hypothetical protein DK853_47765, partial [Klebsiella oxytoca]
MNWTAIPCGANGLYTKAAIFARIAQLKRQSDFPEDSFEHKMLVVLDSLDRESQLKKEVKQMIAAIHEKTKVTIE